MKIIAGLYRRDAGEFLLDGEPVDFTSTAQSKAAGIAVIYQEPTLFPDLSVTENIFMGRQPTSALGRIDRRAMRDEAVATFQPARRRARPRPHRPTASRSPTSRSSRSRRPSRSTPRCSSWTSRPPPSRASRSSGCSPSPAACATRAARILFISHRFDEVFALCDTVTVMRDGAYVDTSPIAETTVDELVRQMVGRDVTDLFPKLDAEIGEVVLEVEGLTRPASSTTSRFTVRAGEIVGLAGLVGAGRSEVARAIFGVDPYATGTVRLHGRPLPQAQPAARDARAASRSCPRTAASRASCSSRASRATSTLAIRSQLARCGLITSGVENASGPGLGEPPRGQDARARHRGRHALGRQPAEGRARASGSPPTPTVLIVDEPTRGIDVGTKAEVHRLLSELAEQGIAILMISSELPEVLGMADRVLVMREGRITARVPARRRDARGRHVRRDPMRSWHDTTVDDVQP